MRRSSVVIVIVIFLTCGGLFVGAVRNLRRDADRTYCINHLKQLGISMQGYHDALRRFPSATASDIWNRKEALAPADQRVSWLFDIVNFYEAHMDEKWQLENSKSWDAPENDYVVNKFLFIFQCPSISNPRDRSLVTHYVGIAGVGRDAIRLPKSDKNAGMFGFDRRLTIDDITDGAAKTIAISETARDNDRWAKPGHASVRGLDPDGGPYLGAAGQFSSHHYDGFWSRRYVTNVALADASVKSLSESVSPRVFEALATIAGGEKIEPGEW